jgi:hypothetical protein
MLIEREQPLISLTGSMIGLGRMDIENGLAACAQHDDEP